MPTHPAIVNEIRSYRRYFDSWAQFGGAARVNEKTIKAWCEGKRQPSPKKAAAALAALRASPEVLAGGVVNPDRSEATSDTPKGEVARKSRGVTTESVQVRGKDEPDSSVGNFPVTPLAKDAGTEVRLMSEWARLTGQFVDGLKTEKLREAAYDHLMLWHANQIKPDHPPQPAVRGAVLRSKKRK